MSFKDDSINLYASNLQVFAETLTPSTPWTKCVITSPWPKTWDIKSLIMKTYR